MINVFSIILSAIAPISSVAVPPASCEIRIQSWCLINSGIYFDEVTKDNDERLWILRGPLFGENRLNIIESRSCGSYFALNPSKSEYFGLNDRSEEVYIVEWTLNTAGSCKIKFQIPVKNKQKNQIIYEFAASQIRACYSNSSCSGPTVSETPRR